MSGRALTNYDVYAVLQHTVGAVVDVRNNATAMVKSLSATVIDFPC